MHFYRTLILLIFISFTSVYGQRNYSVNIRYDKKHAALDSVITRQLMEEEDIETGDVYEGLYGNWSDTKVNPYGMDIVHMIPVLLFFLLHRGYRFHFHLKKMKQKNIT